MIDHSEAYTKAITADSRRQFVRASFDLVDPDAQTTYIAVSDESSASFKEQVPNRGRGESEENIATLETARWLLDGGFTIQPDNAGDRVGQVGWESKTLSGADGTFSTPYPYIELTISNVEILQAVTLEFSSKAFNGYPVDFSLSIWGGSNLLFAKDITGNTETSVVLGEFLAHYPTKIRLTVSKWSLPYREVRVIRLLLGLFETWDTKIIQSLDIYTEVTFSGLKIPYSTCTIVLENKDHRFDPYAPNTIFTSIEDRQAVGVELGLRLEDETVEWLPGGTYYQQSAGWTLKDLTVQWELLDIIGMLAKRKFVVPATLPTTLAGWLEAIMASLGSNFRTNYMVDSGVGGIALTATADSVKEKTCGELLRFLCMATNTWPRQDMATGKLRVGKLVQLEGNRITLANMTAYPEMEANDDVADITFSLDNNVEVTFPGNNTDSEVSLSVKNPFVHTTADAQKAVVSCLFEYGGRSFEVNSRGNPSSECGDIQSVDTQFLSTISARLYKQQLKLDSGIMMNVPSYLVQSPNDSMYANRALLIGSGTWTSTVTGKIKLTLISGGHGGMGGGAGNLLWGDSFDPEDTAGDIGGDGGKVYIIELDVTINQTFNYSCGAGGAGGVGGKANGTFGEAGTPGTPGAPTTFGPFTSESGKSIANGIMDIQSGAVYAQKGGDNGNVVSGLNGSGGSGGVHGKNGKYAQRKLSDGSYRDYIAAKPTNGTNGTAGLAGCILIEY